MISYHTKLEFFVLPISGVTVWFKMHATVHRDGKVADLYHHHEYGYITCWNASSYINTKTKPALI